MRKYPFIALLLFAFICMMASPNMPVFKKKKKKAAADSTAVVDSVLRDSAGNVVADTARMDSLQKAIWKHNQVVDDSIRLDSIARKKSGGVDAPGINFLVEALRPYADILVMAPDSARSGFSCSITSARPLTYKTLRQEEGLTVCSCSGTPTDCVKMALNLFTDRKFDLVIGGQ